MTKNYTLRKVEFEDETLLTPIHSALTGERRHMDRDRFSRFRRPVLQYFLVTPGKEFQSACEAIFRADSTEHVEPSSLRH